ncbi:hypothetical protein M0804_011369 [Polistes exclamans]|nr:hypothetical protein M0804_011369 [Polistes exclamans]
MPLLSVQSIFEEQNKKMGYGEKDEERRYSLVSILYWWGGYGDGGCGGGEGLLDRENDGEGCYLGYLYVPRASGPVYNRAWLLDDHDYTSLSLLTHRKRQVSNRFPDCFSQIAS